MTSLARASTDLKEAHEEALSTKTRFLSGPEAAVRSVRQMEQHIRVHCDSLSNHRGRPPTQDRRPRSRPDTPAEPREEPAEAPEPAQPGGVAPEGHERPQPHLAEVVIDLDLVVCGRRASGGARAPSCIGKKYLDLR